MRILIDVFHSTEKMHAYKQVLIIYKYINSKKFRILCLLFTYILINFRIHEQKSSN